MTVLQREQRLGEFNVVWRILLARRQTKQESEHEGVFVAPSRHEQHSPLPFPPTLPYNAHLQTMGRQE